MMLELKCLLNTFNWNIVQIVYDPGLKSAHLSETLPCPNISVAKATKVKQKLQKLLKSIQIEFECHVRGNLWLPILAQ